MQAFSRAWRIDADAIYCKCCKRGIVQARDGQDFNHRAGCTNKASHPWSILRGIINAVAEPVIPHGLHLAKKAAPSRNRIYLAGPMTGLPDLNFPAFHAEAARLRGLGYDVVNPAELNPNHGASWEDCMRVDIPALLTCGTIALLPGWVDSRGASLEAYIAEKLGMGFFTSVGRIVSPVPKACKGTNCGTTDGFNHSTECLAEAEAHMAEMTPVAVQS